MPITPSQVGMQPASSIKYADFTYQGEKVFAGMEGDTEITFMKKKFFQSALKHILWKLISSYVAYFKVYLIYTDIYELTLVFYIF